MRLTNFNPEQRNETFFSWLSEVETSKDQASKHFKIRDQRLEGSGQWILGSDDFRQWRDGGQPRILYYVGDPGVGKTYLS
jgi:hypothetical protein